MDKGHSTDGCVAELGVYGIVGAYIKAIGTRRDHVVIQGPSTGIGDRIIDVWRIW